MYEFFYSVIAKWLAISQSLESSSSIGITLLQANNPIIEPIWPLKIIFFHYIFICLFTGPLFISR